MTRRIDENRVLVCGCGPRMGCSLGELLFRFERFVALERHVEEMFERTFLQHGPRRLVVNGRTAPRPGARVRT